MALLALIFLCWRFSQRRSSSLEKDTEEIRWPELRADGQRISNQASTRNPLSTRRTGGAGIEMGDDELYAADELKRTTTESESLGSHDGLGIISGPVTYECRPSNSSPTSNQPDTSLDLSDEPYLGPSAAPYPPPQVLYSNNPNYVKGSIPANFNNSYSPPSRNSHYSPDSTEEVLPASSLGHSSSNHGDTPVPYGHFAPHDQYPAVSERFPTPQPTGTPLLSSMPVGGSVSLAHLMSPQVGQLRARNL